MVPENTFYDRVNRKKTPTTKKTHTRQRRFNKNVSCINREWVACFLKKRFEQCEQNASMWQYSLCAVRVSFVWRSTADEKKHTHSENLHNERKKNLNIVANSNQHWMKQSWWLSWDSVSIRDMIHGMRGESTLSCQNPKDERHIHTPIERNEQRANQSMFYDHHKLHWITPCWHGFYSTIF